MSVTAVRAQKTIEKSARTSTPIQDNNMKTGQFTGATISAEANAKSETNSAHFPIPFASMNRAEYLGKILVCLVGFLHNFLFVTILAMKE